MNNTDRITALEAAVADLIARLDVKKASTASVIIATCASRKEAAALAKEHSVKHKCCVNVVVNHDGTASVVTSH